VVTPPHTQYGGRLLAVGDELSSEPQELGSSSRCRPGATSGQPEVEASRVNQSQRGGALLSGQFGCESGDIDQPSATEWDSESKELRFPCGGGPSEGPLLRRQVGSWACLANMCQPPASSQCDQDDQECASTSMQAKEVWLKGSGEAQTSGKDQESNVTLMLPSSAKTPGGAPGAARPVEGSKTPSLGIGDGVSMRNVAESERASHQNVHDLLRVILLST
jgi:hypothetical protein